MPTTAPAIAQHAGAFCHGEVNATHRATHVSPAIGTQEFAGHELHIPCDAHVVVTVIGSSPNRTSAMRPMTVVIHGITIPVHGVDAVDIIHVSIPVIIHAIAGNLIGVCPHLPHQILMGIADARINDCHNHIRGPSCGIPCGERAQIYTGNTAVLARIIQTP